MICLYCGKPAEHLEDYNGVPIGTCKDGHRTGTLIETGTMEEESNFKAA